MNDVVRSMERLFVGVPGARLRQEDERKAVEVAALLGEIEQALRRCGQRPVTVVDAASGKTYVGLVAAELILGPRGHGRVIAIEREPKRAAVAAAAARMLSAGVEIEVRVGDVGDAELWPAAPDVVVALHACGPAADLVIDRAVAHEAKHLLLVPCCTSESMACMTAAVAAAERQGIPRHAGVRRRYLQAFVDAERTLRLEASGYETEVVELCPPTVTPHNLLFRARRVGEPNRKQAARTRLGTLLGQ